MPQAGYTSTITLGDERNVVSVFVPGKDPLVADSENPRFDEIFDAVRAKQPIEDILHLFDLARAIKDRFARLSDRIALRGHQLFLDGDPLDNSLAEQVLRFFDAKQDDWKPLVKFYEKLLANPNKHSREQFYPWLAQHNFTITTEGDVVGYKGVKRGQGSDFLSENGEPANLYSTRSGPAIVNGVVHHDGFVPQPIGGIVEMARSQVKHDPADGCASGLHVGTHSFATKYGDTMLEVHFNPRDVVSVPTDCDWAKVRVCRYHVVRVIDGPINEPVVPAEPEPEDLEYDEDCETCSDCGGCIPHGDCECDDPDSEEADQAAAEDSAAWAEAADEAAAAAAPAEDPPEPVKIKHPTNKEFDEMVGRAKRRRQNFIKYAAKMGPWTLLEEDGVPFDGTSRKHWAKG
jgi:hypothetical protein